MFPFSNKPKPNTPGCSNLYLLCLSGVEGVALFSASRMRAAPGQSQFRIGARVTLGSNANLGTALVGAIQIFDEEHFILSFVVNQLVGDGAGHRDTESAGPKA